MKNRYKQAIDIKKRRPLSIQMRHRLREGLFLIAVACAVFLLIALLTYHTGDPGWLSTGQNIKIANWGGRVGAWLADVFLSLFGIVAYLFPFLVILSSWLWLEKREELIQKGSREWIFTLLGWIFLVAGSSGLVHFYLRISLHLPVNAGGIIGDVLGHSLFLFFNKTGSTLLFVTTLLCGITLVTGLSWFGLIDYIGERVYQVWHYLRTPRQAIVKPFEKNTVELDKSKRFSRQEPVLSEEIIPFPQPPKLVI